MIQDDDGDPAFPVHHRDGIYEGMSLAQWYGGQALAGFCANANLSALHNMVIDAGEMTPAEVRTHLADMAWRMADEMLKGGSYDTERESDRALRVGEKPRHVGDGGDGGGDGKEVAEAPDVGEREKGY